MWRDCVWGSVPRRLLSFFVVAASMASRYNPDNRFPKTNPLPEYGDDQPDDEPYSNHVRKALLDIRGPASVRKIKWGVRLNNSRGTGGANMTWPHAVSMWLPGDVQRMVEDALDDVVAQGFVVRVGQRKYQITEMGRMRCWGLASVPPIMSYTRFVPSRTIPTR